MILTSLLSHAKASSDLRQLMLKYTPPKIPSNLYGYAERACDVLDEVRKIVCASFDMWVVLQTSFVGLWR